MNAKEMFDGMLYRVITDDVGSLVYITDDDEEYIRFHKTNKFVERFMIAEVSGRKLGLPIGVELHLAIHQQMKELGWIE